MSSDKIFAMPFAKVFPLLIAKAERKGRTRAEVYEVTTWLTGYTAAQLDALLEEFLNEPLPAFEEPDTTVVAAEPEEYRNFSNDYGQTLPKEEKPCVDEDRQRAKRENDERTVVALMAVASVECLGILAILVYWLKMFL